MPQEQSDAQPAEQRQNVDTFLTGAIALLTASQQERRAIREQSKVIYGGLLDAHRILLSLIASAVMKTHMRPGNTSASISDRMSLFASFIQGIDLAETAITEGLYTQATALMKQQMETVSAMSELVTGERKDGRTPNVKHLWWRMAVHYQRINDLAHVGRRELLRDFYQVEARGKAVPVSVTPRFSANAAKYLYTLHVALLLQFSLSVGELLEDLYGEAWNSDELRFLLQAHALLEQDGAFSEQAPGRAASNPNSARPAP
jgi:hypothetical protein